MHKWTRNAGMMVSFFWMAVTVSAQVPQLINYQGRLVDGGGLVNGDVSMVLRLYNTNTLGAVLYADSNTITVVDGLYATFIGDNPTPGSPALSSVLTNRELYLELQIGGTVLAPRERIAAVCYAQMAATVPGGTVTTGMLDLASVDSRYVRKSGDSMSGGLILPATGLTLGEGRLSYDSGGSLLGIGFSQEALDQQQVQEPTALANTTHWQSFTAGQNGTLSKIGLKLLSTAATGTLTIRSGEGTGGSALYTKPLSWTGTGWHEESIAGDVVLVAGQTYTMELSLSALRIFNADNTNPYPAGRAGEAAGWDYAFRTYVRAGGTLSLTVRDNGNVGINTNAPSERLEVAGNVKASGFLGDGSGLRNLAESDPVYAAAAAAAITNAGGGAVITGAERTRLGTVYGWGDHGTNGYLKVYAESDPHALLASGARAMGGDLDMADHSLTNVKGIALGGVYHTNWPAGGSGSYVLKGGDTMTGLLTLPGDPSAALHAATKQYVDSVAGSGGGRTTLSSLDDTSVLTPGAGSLLLYDGADSWDNKPLSGAVTVSAAGVASLTDNAVTVGKIALGAVASNRIDWATMPAGLQDGDDGANYTAGAGIALAAGAFSISNAGVTTVKMAGGAVTGPKIADATITVGKVTTNAFWRADGNAGTDAASHFLGTTDDRPLVIKVNGQRALTLQYLADDFGRPAASITMGCPSNEIAANVQGATIGGGGHGTKPNRVLDEADYATIVGGYGNTVSNAGNATILGGTENAIWQAGHWATIGGGDGNEVEPFGVFAAIGGGIRNRILWGADHVVIGGGYQNRVSTNSGHSVIGGGYKNLVRRNTEAAVLCGGRINAVGDYADYASIGGGEANEIGSRSLYAAIAGGRGNIIRDDACYGFVGGGMFNDIAAVATNATIGGGMSNAIFRAADHATISGGKQNAIGANALFSVVAGGSGNAVQADAYWGTIAGGTGNFVSSGAWGGTLGGGLRNSIFYDARYATIPGGSWNSVSNGASHAVIGGGVSNSVGVSATGALISGGRANVIEQDAEAAAVSGGAGNRIGKTSVAATLAGGEINRIGNSSTHAVIGGGERNVIGHSCPHATVAGGRGNAIDTGAIQGFVGGGVSNTIGTWSPHALIGGGLLNTIAGYTAGAAIGGGASNEIDRFSSHSVLAGGLGNAIDSDAACAAIGGGETNAIRQWSTHASIGGGWGNVIDSTSPYSVVGGGQENSVLSDSECSVIGGGKGNAAGAGDYAVVGGGLGNGAVGKYATVPGGVGCFAWGANSLAAGKYASAFHEGSFVWGDSQNAAVGSTARDQFIIRAAGNVGINTTSPRDTLEVAGPILSTGTGANPSIRLRNSDHDEWRITSYNQGKLMFWSGANRMAILTNGNVGIGTENPLARLSVGGTGLVSKALAVYGKGTDGGGYFVGGDGILSVGVTGISEGNSGRGVFGVFKGPDNSAGTGVFGKAADTVRSASGVHGEARHATATGVSGFGGGYNFFASGPGVDYAPFTGAHEVKLAAGFPTNPAPGLIVSATGKAEARVNEGGAVNLSSTLPTVALAEKENDSAVLGVLVVENELRRDHWHQGKRGERFAAVNALGEGRVWVSDAAGEIRAGDYITTSAVPGHGQRQADDVLHSYTLGKAIETPDWANVAQTIQHDGREYKVHLIAVVYTSG